MKNSLGTRLYYVHQYCVPFSTRPKNTSDMSSAEALTLLSRDFFNSNTVMESVSTCVRGGEWKTILYDETTSTVQSYFNGELFTLENLHSQLHFPRLLELSRVEPPHNFQFSITWKTHPHLYLRAPYRILRKSVNYHDFVVKILIGRSSPSLLIGSLASQPDFHEVKTALNSNKPVDWPERARDCQATCSSWQLPTIA